MANVTISYIVVRYKIRKELFNLLDSIYAQKKSPSFEIIVVDNNIEDRIQKELQKKYPKVIYVPNEVNNGLGGGVNLGNKTARGEYIYVVNPDMVLEPTSTHILYSFIKKDKYVGLVSPSYTLENGERPVLQVGTRRLNPVRGAVALSAISSIFKNNRIYNNFYITNRNDSKDLEVDAVPGGAFLIKKNIFDKVGGFDEKFFLYFEEHDLSNRVKELGYKNYILATARVFHIGGIDSVNLQTTKTFQKSRFYYFRKHYGVLSAYMVQAASCISRRGIISFGFISTLLFIGLFLRTDRLSQFMSFIADQGFFYLSARDMLLDHTVPLVGLPTSHPWIHHGPLWTYALGVLLFLFNYNPIMPGYFIAALGTLTIFVFYLCVRNMFSERIAIAASILYTCSPLIVLNARIPYHTSPIPFFVILLLFAVYKWVNGSSKAFIFIPFLLAVLYNHEITTFVYTGAVILIFLFGLITKKKWVLELKNLKVILTSSILFIIPMIPFILYDTQNGYKQTVGFLIWVIYRLAKFPLGIIFPQYASAGSNSSTLAEFFHYYTLLVFAYSPIISVMILLATSASGLLYLYKRKKMVFSIRFNNVFTLKFNTSRVLLFLFFGIGLFGLFIHRVPIEADTLLIAPMIIIITVIALSYLLRNNFRLLLTCVVLISTFNIYYLLMTNYATHNVHQVRINYTNRTNSIEKIILLSKGKPFNIKGRGVLGSFPVFTMPYEYLLWYKGHPISINSLNIIYIEEKGDKIILNTK